MVTRPITEPEFDELLRSFKRTAFRLETRYRYALGYERADYDDFLDGTPVAPPQVNWWRPWLDQIKRLTAEGKKISRVRVLDEPPSNYQRWELWAAPWHAEAGEEIRYIPRSRYDRQVDLPTEHDWWLLDDERVILMWFTEDDEIDHKVLMDDPGVVARYLRWRDLAVQNATPAEDHAAA
jgi:hypothetical protein